VAFIEFRNISLNFDERMLFSKYSLKIRKNEKVLFNGPSGKGKTTLVKMLLGFIKPQSGEILVDGLTVSGHTINTIRRRIAYISQDADIPRGPVKEVFREVFGFTANRQLKFDEEVLHEWLERLSLPKDTAEKAVDSLSGGERQRLAFIMGILLDREIWILDEITTGLDQELKQKLVEIVLSYEKTVLIISHDEIYEKHGLREVDW
jgi:putative ABC transport system ATP-binding protein